jgi:hypothetical protein
MLPIPEVSQVEVVFPADPPLPPVEEIPEEFWETGNPWTQIASGLFFKGGSLYGDYGILFKEHLSTEQKHNALRAIMACLGSLQPKHEHKEAGVGYMLSEWFDMRGGE